MRSMRSLCRTGFLFLPVGAALCAPRFAPAQFNPVAHNQRFGNTGEPAYPPPGIPFVDTNWALDAPCATGIRIADGSRLNSPPNSMKMLRGNTGTRLIHDLNPGAGSTTFGSLQWSGNDVITRMFFAADPGTGTGMEVYRAWEILYPTTLLELDLNPGAAGSSPDNFFRMASNAGHVLYAADDGTSGVELHKLQAGGNFFTMQNVLVKDINPTGSSDPGGFVTTRNKTSAPANIVVVFAADDGVNGRELWKTDGDISGANTALVMDINQTPTNAASSDPQQMTEVGTGETRTAYFTADDGVTGRELWRTDGSLAGTGRLKDFAVGAASSNPSNLTAGGGAFTNTLFFTVDSDGVNGQELWKSNGALDGSDTVMIKDIGGSPTNFNAVGSTLFFTIGNTLWKSDGGEAGTVAVQTFNSLTGPLVSAGTLVYFVADDGGGAGTELWKSDGANTSLVHDVNPGAAGSEPANLLAVGSRVYFSADDGTYGREPWRTDTAPAAVLVKDVNPGSAGSNPARFTTWPDGEGTSNSLVFTADDGVHGTELWQTDGNPVPTQYGISHKWDLVPVIQSVDATRDAVAGTDASAFAFGCILDAPTNGGGSNHQEVRQAVHQINFLLEITDGVDRAPIVLTDIDCADGSGFTRPRLDLTGDGQAHNVFAFGLLAVADQDPCDTSAIGPQSPKVPLMEVPVIFDGLNWKPMTLANFPTMQQGPASPPFSNTNGMPGSNLLPTNLTQATIEPYGSKRFNTLRIDVLTDTVRFVLGKRQGSADPAPGDTVWVATVPRQYLGAFRAAHLGTPACVPSPWHHYVDEVFLTGGVFTSGLDPYGACCAPSGCSDVASQTACPVGTFSPWTGCGEIICCPMPWPDADRDGDVDATDFAGMQRCLTGGVPEVTAECTCFDHNNDNRIDVVDLEAFIDCGTGPGITGSVPPGC